MSDCQNLQIEVSLVHNPFDRRDRTSVVKTVEVRTLAELANEVVPKGVEVVASINGQVVEREDWGSRELRVKDSVTFLPTTGDSDVLRIVSFIAVAIVSAGAGAIIGGMGFTGAAFAGAAASVGISMIGGLIINALLPPKLEKPELESPSQAYSWNPVTTQSQGIAIPTVYGTYRVNGNIIAGNTQQKEEYGIYLNALVSLGMGPVKGIRDIKINDQPDPMSNFEGVSIETRRGFVNQAPITVGTFGEGVKTEYNPNVTIEQGNSYTYVTPGSNFDSLEIVIAWPQGLVVYSNKGKARRATVEYSLEARKVGTTEWINVDASADETTLTNYNGVWVAGYYNFKGKFTVVTSEASSPDAHSEGDLHSVTHRNVGVYWRWVENENLPTGVVPTIKKSGSKAGEPFYNTHKINIYDKGQYEIRATFVNAYLSRDNNPITTTVFATVREVENTRFTYPREALVGIEALATEQLSGGFNFSALVDGKLVRVWNGTSWSIEWSNNPAWVCWDILTQPVYNNTQVQTSMGWMQVYSGADLSVSRYDGFDPSELDLNSFYTWAQYCDYVLPSGSKRCTFNGTFDQTSSLWRAAIQVAEVGRASLMRTGTKVSVVIEKVWADPKPLVTTSSMLKWSFKETFLALEDRAVEIEATYNDRAMDYNRTVINVYNPNITSASKKQSLDLRGITNADEAWRAARLRLALTETLKTFCEFEMSINAVGFTVGDVIDVQSDVPEWGFGGRVVSGTTNSIELDQKVSLGTGSFSIMVKGADGTVETKGINESSGDFSTVTLVSPLSFIPEKYAVWAIGKVGQTVKPFRVMGISKSGDLDVKISAIEYNETVYNVDTDGKVLPTPDYSQTQVLPLVTNLSVNERIEYANKYQVERYLDVTFSKPLGTYSRLHVYFNKDGTGWKSWGYVNGSFSIPGIEADAQYEIAITTVGKDGRESNLRSAPKYLILTSTNSPAMPANPYMVSGIQGLGLKGGGLISNTRNFHLAWDSFVSAWTPALWFKYFKIEVLTTGLVLLRTEYTTSFEFIYTYEFAKADGFYRDVVFKVYVVDQDGNESPDQSITISNPQVGQVQNVTIDGGYLGATVKWDAIDADDLAGYQVLLSTDGINYGIASRVSPGTTSATFSALPGGTIYAKVGAYDYFGELGITYSVAASATVASAAPATDPESFRKDATETFDVPILDGHSFAAGISSLSWNAHDLYHNGTKYPIASGSTGFKYVWWDVLSPSAYQSSDTKPTLDQSAGQFHIAVYYGADDFDLVWHAAPNQVVGSGYFQRASINTAHIDHIDASTANITNIWADKIRVGGSPVAPGALAIKDQADYGSDVVNGPPADATKGADWNTNITGKPADSELLNSQQQWASIQNKPNDLTTLGNLINPYDDWVPGTYGNQGSFIRIGEEAENRVVMGLGPFGVDEEIWECLPDNVSGPDGGWYNDSVRVDPSKTYIWGCYFWTLNNSGRTYLGCRPVERLDGTEDANPYFLNGHLPSHDRWYLALGVVHPAGYTGGAIGLSGLYDVETGEKVLNGTEYRFKAGTTTQRHRAYHYYNTSGDLSTVYQRMSRPFVMLASKLPPLEALTKKMNTIQPGADVTSDNESKSVANQRTYKWYGAKYLYPAPKDSRQLRDEFGVAVNSFDAQRRSYTLSVFDRATMTWDSHAVYDLHMDATQAQALANALNALDHSKIVVVGGQHAPAGNRTLSGLPEAIYRCGGSRTVFVNENWGGNFPTYFLAGIPGQGEGTGIEAFAPASIGDLEVSFTIKNGNLVGATKTPDDVKPGADVTATSEFVQAIYPADKTALQNDIDSKIISWFTSSDPSTSWSGTNASHAGDMWWNPSTNKLRRYSGTEWSAELTDQTAINAYAKAATAQDTADEKRRVFVSTPTPPYDVGDLWDRGSALGIWRAKTATTTAYSLTHWQAVADITANNPQSAAWLTDAGVLATLDSIDTSYVTDAGDLATVNADALVYFSSTAPSDPANNPLWVDTSSTPYKLKRWSGTTWEVIATLNTGALADVDAADWQSQVSGDGKPADYADVTATSEFVTSIYPSDKAQLEEQIDGKIYTWFQSADPNTWAAGDRAKHNGDIWFKTDTNEAFRYNGGTNAWDEIKDKDALNALSAASYAQDTADSKRRVFTATPVAPYDVGDLWDRGATVGIWRCVTARAAGESYSLTHWARAADVTGNNTANDVLTGPGKAVAEQGATNDSAWRAGSDTTLIDGGKIYTGSITADKIAAGTITSDVFESTFYGNLSQAINVTQQSLAAGAEYKKEITRTDLNNAIVSDIDREPHPDHAESIRLFTQRRWDGAEETWDTGYWDVPVAPSGTFEILADLGSEQTLQISLDYFLDRDPNTSITVEAIYSLDNVNWGSNDPGLNDGVWETLSANEISSNSYRATGSIYTLRYYRFKITLSTTDTNNNIIVYDMVVRGSVVYAYAAKMRETIAAGGTTFQITGFKSNPAITVTPFSSVPLIPVVTVAKATEFTVKLFNLSGVSVGGKADIIYMGV
jgi:sulfur carrier protein ThiS